MRTDVSDTPQPLKTLWFYETGELGCDGAKKYFKNGVLASAYPFSAALVVVGFDMSDYVGKTAARSMLLALFGLGLMLLLTALLLALSGRQRETKAPRTKKGAGRRKINGV